MGKPIHVLIVEDSEDDALMEVRELKRGGYTPIFERVETSESMRTALDKGKWDVILADYSLPSFSAPVALRLMQEMRLDLPFIIVTGTVTDDMAVAAMKSGAHDYIVKGNLKRLVPAIERERREAEVRWKHKQAEEDLLIAEGNFRNSIENSPLGIRIVTAEGELVYVNKTMLDIVGYSSFEELKAIPISKLYTSESYAQHLERREKRKLGKVTPTQYEISLVRKDGQTRHLVASRKPVVWNGELQFQVIYQDITERKEMEKALRESEEFRSSLLNNSPFPILTLNPDTSLGYVNPAFEKLTGFSYAEIAGIKSPDYPWWMKEEETVKEMSLMLGEALTEGVSGLERCFQKKNGEQFWVEINGVAVSEGDKFKFFLSNWVDITERKKAEERLRESEEKIRAIFDSLALGVIVSDLNGKILELNEAKVRMHGYDSREELIGRNLFELISEKDYTRVMENRKRRIEQGFIGHAEYTYLKKDGSEFPGEVSNTVFRDASGNPIGIISITEDITERKRTEEEIRRAAEEWRTTFDSITDLVSIHGSDFKLVRVNKAFADSLNMKPQELIGKTCYQIVHGTNEPISGCPHMKTLETEMPATLIFLEPKLGIYMEVSTSPIFNEKGEVIASVHVARDITERKKMEEQLILTDRLASIGELASGIAHELNNPLTSVIGFSELLLERKDIPDNINEDLRTINREAQRTAGIVRNLLTFARKHAPTKQPVDINAIITNVLALRAYEHNLNNIRVDSNFAIGVPELMADGFQLQQVFLNIIINAEFFMVEAHGRGTLTITTEQVGDIMRISFADDGPGMPKENLSHIFDPFFTTKEVGKGTGLGLSICHGIITAHGGRIYAESELGKGATFVIELPISKSQ